MNRQRFKIKLNHPDFYVIEKPAGLNFHSENGEMGFVVQCQQQLKELMDEGTELYPVHRLDKMTSGLVILAKNRVAAQKFQRLFAQKQIEKVYLALSAQKPKKKQGWIKGDMVPARRGSWKLTRTQHHPAITYFESQGLANEKVPGFASLRLFYLYPKTGKTHQIRVALKSIGAPILGDERYADKVSASKQDRGYLHAFGLKFEWAGEMISLYANPQEGVLFQSAPIQQLIREKMHDKRE
ncbi:TIGR01621 family pseudouridine synthase [Galenea microaerophila]